jgi:A/G-specific adenine glycosylase
LGRATAEPILRGEVPAGATSDLRRRLTAWYRANARDLPWRAPDRTPWGVLVSEVMLQQTPVARVLPVWTEWLHRWPEPPALATAEPGAAIRHWGRLGYPRRALRLHQAAGRIVEAFDGQVPRSYEGLRTLPGIGGYTAAAVASFAFGARHAVVDTNVRRVQARLVTGVALPAPALTSAEQRLADSLLPSTGAAAATWNVAVMELGALVCTARAPACGQCPVREQCAWRRAGSPPYDGRPHPVQAWSGTDRQMRGRLLQALRDSTDPLSGPELVRACPPEVLRDPGQRDRCLDSLVADGLVEPLSRGRYRLPA